MKKGLPGLLSFSFRRNIVCPNKLLRTTSLLFLLIFLAANYASAQKPVDSQAVKILVKPGKITEYPNGIFKIFPQAFGITGPVRNLPTSVEDAKAKSEAYLTKQKLAEIRKQQMREKGISEEEIQKDELNRINAKRIKKALPGAGAGEGSFQDPLVNPSSPNSTTQILSMPAPLLTFDGATQADNAAQGIGAVLPPDVNGDIGLNHFVSSVNLVYKIFNKNGTVAAGPFKTSDLWSGLPAGDPCRINNDGDPVVVYDPLADRWHISQFALTGTTNCQCAAVSVTGDPTGAYYVWRYDYPNQLLNDYPKVGVWPDAYHMTFNQFNNAGTAFLGMGILSQDRPKALAGDPTASVVYTNIATIDPGAGGGLPADIDGLVPPPAGLAEVIAEYRADEFGDPLDAIRYYRWVPNFVTPGSSSITVLPDVVLAPFDARNPAGRGDIEQSGGANLDAISDRLMHLFKYRNLGTQAAPINSFIGNFSVNVSGVNPTTAATYQTGIRWFEMRRAADVFSVFDQGTHNLTPGNGATGLNNWMGSMAQDNDGNLALGFSQSSTTQRADIKIAGRTNNVANSGVLNEGEALFHAANGSQTSTSNRWGDYSSMNVDPTDDCTFWYTQEYYATTGGATWSTRVGSFKYPSCTPAPKATINGTITTCTSGLPVNGASVDATGGYNRVTGAPGTYSMTVAPGTYTVSASKAGGFASASSTVTVVDGQTVTVNLCMTGVPLLAATTATLVNESCLPANGIIDPGETVTVAFGVQNTGAENTVNDIGTLQATGGVTAPGGSQTYGVIVAGGPSVSRNFTFTADPALVCGANITATISHVDGATNFGSYAYTLPTGALGVTPTTISYAGPSVAIPDNVPAGVNIILPVSGITGAIGDLNFRLDALAGCDATIGNTNASVTHTFNADLAFKLTSPAGTTVALITNRGSGGNNFCAVLLDDDGAFPATSTMTTAGAINGNFAPENLLSAFDGQNANGNWTLNVADNAGVDVGTLNRFSLIITERICCTNVPVPVINAGTVTGTITACAGTASASPAIQQFTVSGTNLTANIGVNAPTNFEVSTSAGSGYISSLSLTQAGGNVPSTTIYVRSATSAPAGPISGNVTLISAGATTINVAVSGTITTLPTITAPTVSQPTCSTLTGTIAVNATGSGALQYSLNNGPYQNSSLFLLLGPGSYNITVRLTASPTCIANYSGNPVVLTAATGCCVPPTITAPTVTQPTCATGVGSIVVNATGGGTLEYALNNGTYQTSNTFSNLTVGNYNITVRLQASPSCLAAYTGNPVAINAPSCPGKTIPGRVEAEAWDTKSGPQYAVATGDPQGGVQHVVGIVNGSWMDYNVVVLQNGMYNVTFRVATTQNNPQFQVKLGATVLGTVSIPNTGGWNTWQNITVNNIPLTAGVRTIRIQLVGNETCNFNWTDWVVAGVNTAPTANAGPNQSIVQPASQVTLAGSGSANNGGTIISHVWSKFSGPAGGNITDVNNYNTTVTGLQLGTYVFRLTVTDNAAQTATSDVTIIVNPASGKFIPGRIEAEAWDTKNGPQYSVPTTDPEGGVRHVIGMSNGSWLDYNVNVTQAGAYTVIFRVATTQNSSQFQIKQGANILATVNIPNSSGWDNWINVPVTGVPLAAGVQTLRIQLSSTESCNFNWMDWLLTGQATGPTANAGPNQNITLPTNQVTLAGSGTAGAGGTISSHVWSKFSGGVANITDPNNYGTTVTNLAAGTYVFRLTVNQNDGQTATSDVTITVNPVAGNGKTIPGKVEAEAWDAKSGPQYAVPTGDAGGGQQVVGMTNGSWLDYNVNVLQTGSYTVNFRVATTQNNVQFQIRSMPGNTLLKTVSITNTGGWDNWQTVVVNDIALTAGQQTIRIQLSSNESCNFNFTEWFFAAAPIAPPLTVSATRQSAAGDEAKANKLQASVLPNPTSSYFNLRLQTKSMEQVTVRILDIAGRQVQQLKGNPGQAMRFGDNIVNGAYFVEVRQGSEKVLLKVMKQ